MKQPVVFSPHYDMTMMGLEKLHPFDSAKYGKVFRALVEGGMLDGRDHHVPVEASAPILLRVHTQDYLRSLRRSSVVAGIAELPVLSNVPNLFLQSRLLRPMRYATGGTLLATRLALDPGFPGWAINLGGGFHHAKAAFAHGFCFYADINIAAQHVWDHLPTLKILVLDLDAHQGNGFAHTFGDEARVAVMDVYNGDIFPQDGPARRHVRHDYPIRSGTGTEAYLALLRRTLPGVLDAEKPGLVVYNAGSDIYERDPLGQLGVSADGVVARDQFVWEEVRGRGIPMVMLLSGGYVKDSAALIARSILNLHGRGLLPRAGSMA